jgi:hypothetical protein
MPNCRAIDLILPSRKFLLQRERVAVFDKFMVCKGKYRGGTCQFICDGRKDYLAEKAALESIEVTACPALPGNKQSSGNHR